MNKKYLNLSLFVLLAIYLLFLKIDFRFAETIYCCGDDHDYFIHAESISQDFDLDYTNQLKGLEDKRFNKNGKIAPIGFIGSGVLAAPFMFVGNILDSLIQEKSNILNYKFLFYSLSPIFYFFLSFKMIISTFRMLEIKYKKHDVLILLCGSGVIYYGFERFSMTHIYEVFSGVLVFYLSTKYYTSLTNKNLYSFLIPFSVLLGLLVRWTNYFFVFIPIICKFFSNGKTKGETTLIKERYFQLANAISIFLFLFHTQALYGRVTIDPRYIYSSDINLNTLGDLGSNPENSIIFDYLNNLRIIFFSQEFGSIYFSPIIAFSFIFIILNFLNKKIKPTFAFIILISYFQVFSLYFIWQSSGSAYGLRYLYGLIPLSIFSYYYLIQNRKSNIFHNSLLVFSVFLIISILFFETTESTQLSLEGIINSWGHGSMYAQRYYLSGLLSSFFVFDAYLKIFTTSFLGAIFFKFLLTFLPINDLNNFLTNLGLPVENEDFQLFLNEVNNIRYDKFLIVALSGIFLISFFYKKV